MSQPGRAPHHVSLPGANRFIITYLPDQLPLQNDPPLVEVGVNMGVVRLLGLVTYQDGQITPIGQQLLGPRWLSVARQDVANSYLQRLGGGSHLLHNILLLALCGARAVGYHRLRLIPLAVAEAHVVGTVKRPRYTLE